MFQLSGSIMVDIDPLTLVEETPLRAFVKSTMYSARQAHVFKDFFHKIRLSKAKPTGYAPKGAAGFRGKPRTPKRSAKRGGHRARPKGRYSAKGAVASFRLRPVPLPSLLSCSSHSERILQTQRC